MKQYRFLLLSFVLLVAGVVSAAEYVVASPDGHLRAVVSDAGCVTWTIQRDGNTVLAHSAIRIATTTAAWGEKTRVQKASRRAILETIPTVAYKRAVVKNECNEMTLTCSGEFNLVVRFVW